jgi:hypothetical protein
MIIEILGQSRRNKSNFTQYRTTAVAAGEEQQK